MFLTIPKELEFLSSTEKTNLSIGGFLVGLHPVTFDFVSFSFQAFQIVTSPLKPGAFNLLIFFVSSVGAFCGED